MFQNSKIFYKFERLIYALIKPHFLRFFDKFSNDEVIIDFDLVFVIPDGKAWILKGISEEIAIRLPESIRYKIVDFSTPLPKARLYFFSHFLLYSRSYILNRHVRKNSKNFIYYTHFENEDKIRFVDLINHLNYSSGVFCMNSSDLNFLSHYIHDKDKLFLTIGAFDSRLFTPVNRLSNKYIGFSSNFYDRKNPDLILEIIQSNPNREFKIIGSGWEKYEKFQELNNLKNLKIIETSYLNYPEEYQSLRIFISVSKIEGGPLPTLEALACNVFPIVTDTGFNSEVIVHGKNGFVVDKDVKVSEITDLIDLAWDLEVDVSQSVQKFNWESFSGSIFSYIGINS